MINEFSHQPETPANINKEIEKEFIIFIESNKFTAEQLREAYLRLCGISENKDQDPEVEKIFAKMDEMSENGFPLNQIADIIGSKEDLEDAVPKYYQYIESLNISSKEKSVLNSIVKEEKSGEVECLVNSEVVASFRVKKLDVSIGILAAEIVDIISKIIKSIPPDKKFEFMFIEN